MNTVSIVDSLSGFGEERASTRCPRKIYGLEGGQIQVTDISGKCLGSSSLGEVLAGLWAKFGLLPVFVNKVLLVHSDAHSLYMLLLCMYRLLSDCVRDHTAHKP
jgi:hypothetical protein